MTPAETARVLIKLAAYDQRTIGDGDVAAWHEVIGPLDYADCLNAVTVHYREQSARAMPADIRKLALGIRETRQSRERQREQRAAIEAGPTRDRSDEVTAMVRAVVDSLPKPDIHERARARARRERGRPDPTPTKSRKQFKKPKDYPPPQTADVASLATRYLIDGHAPVDVAERLGVSRRWCERTIRRVKPTDGEAS